MAIFGRERSTVYIEGLRELDAALGELKKSTAKAVLRKVGRNALEPVVEVARQLVPVDEGDLLESLTVSTKLTRRQRRAHKKDSDPATVELFAGAGGLPQATLREFGGDENPPQPFMRPAWMQKQSEVLATIVRDLGVEIDKAAKRAAARAARMIARTGG